LDRGLIIFIIVGAMAIYLTNTFVGSIQDSDRYQNSGYSENSADNDEQYQGVNSIGDIVLDVSSLDAKKQITVWNRSEMKQEFLSSFPNFGDMKYFVDNKIIGDSLKKKLNDTIDFVEDKFVAGEMKVDEAKRKFTL